MNVVSVFPALVALIILIFTIRVLISVFKTTSAPVKFVSIDGLRGYLAFFVFLHHSCIWYFYLRSQRWEVPPSNMYTHFGEQSVLMFFMITGFLFTIKLIETKNNRIDWIQLYVSRLYRLFPVYLLAIIFVMLLVGVLSGFKIQEPVSSLIKKIIIWLTFCIVGQDDINKVYYTSVMTAGVTWTLGYEWLFYCCLPSIALLFFKIKTSIITIILSLIAVVIIFHYLRPTSALIIALAIGVFSAILSKYKKFTDFAVTNYSSFIIIILLLSAAYFFKTAYITLPLMIVSLAFAMIACGSTIFGLLSYPVSRVLGKITYCIYLFHGLALFVTFKFIIGFDKAARMSAIGHWLVVFLLIIPLTIICFAIHIFIELPGIKKSNNAAVTIKKFLGGIASYRLK